MAISLSQSQLLASNGMIMPPSAGDIIEVEDILLEIEIEEDLILKFDCYEE